MAFWDAWLQQGKAVYASMGTRERIIVAGGSLVMLVGLFAFAFVGPSSGRYETLSATPFDPTEQARAMQLLAAAGIKTVIQEGQLLVPRESVGPARMLLASQNALPSQGFGFPDMVSRQPFLGRHDQDRNWLIALQGELEEAIETIDGVLSARVIVNPGDENPSVMNLDREYGKPTASVLLRLRGRDRLSDEAVGGIRNLIAAAQRGLKPDDVKVADTTGRTYEPRRREPFEQASTLLALQEQIESYYSAKVRSLFVATPGVVAVVNARLKANEIERQISRVNPDEVVDLLRKTVEERKEHLGEKAGAVTGVDSNIGTDLAASGDSGQKLVDTRTEEEVQSEATRIVEKIIEKPGDLVEMTASVRIPRPRDPAAGEGEAQTVPLSDEDLAKLKKQVMGACGITDPRLVEVMDFDPPAGFYPAPASWWRDLLAEVAREPAGLLLGVASLMAIFFLSRAARAPAAARRREAAEAAAREAEKAVPELKLPELSPEEKMEDQVRQAVQKNPQLAAGLVRRWLLEDSERGRG